MNKLFSNLWLWVILLHLIVVGAWYYLTSITPEPKYTPATNPANKTEPATK